MAASRVHTRCLCCLQKLFPKPKLNPKLILNNFSSNFNLVKSRAVSSVLSKDGWGKGAKFEPFQVMVERRRSEASRSILFFLSERSCLENLIEYCNSHGKVQNCFEFYQNAYFAVVEFKKKESVKLIQERVYSSRGIGRFNDELIQNRLLKYNIKSSQASTIRPKNIVNKDFPNSQLIKTVCHGDSVSNQIEMLATEQALTDEGIRMRFLVCTLIEDACRKMFPECEVLPFGSSVNNFGKRNCDVDMFIDPKIGHGMIPVAQSAKKFKVEYDQSSADNERIATQNTLRTLSKYLEKCVPHCTNVLKILHATCPLVKFKHQALGLSCDLTANNRGAIDSSEMLYIFSKLDKRVQPLVFLIRHWCRYHGLTNKNPGQWITNYPLTLLVVVFLQTRRVPILPKLVDLINADLSFDDIDYSFPDLKGFPHQADDTSLADLLHEFFVFCTKFDFGNQGLSVRHGSVFHNDSRFPLFIENPLVYHLNCCKNVTKALVTKLRSSAAEALWVMDQPGFLDSTPWGIGMLFLTPRKLEKIQKEQNVAAFGKRVGRVLGLFPN
ncbi:poly(A) RNA polymerase, mitochondrial-like [Anneissia japonica]|uniref:poly(A) RNA polymerase, mitochondrial-like n=1 Tax=Anneissia japonica TaxID=1529436 RepID=UPI00142558F4|nr:poly(A) RNA polymerase, mitochondrial-like [Anneissia japonica]